MEEAGENIGEEKLPARAITVDLMQKFMGKNTFRHVNGKKGVEDEGEIELSLGLSSNGKFGLDPKGKLMRASSVATFMLNGEENQEQEVGIGVGGVHAPPLIRTCSMPSVTEEEWRKRKELQCLRRMEAKRRRMVKMKFPKLGGEKVGFGEENGGGDGLYSGGRRGVNGGSNLPLSQGSIGSQGSGSSGLSELETQPNQENKNGEKSTSSIYSNQSQNEQKRAITQPSTAASVGADKGSKKLMGFGNDMPRVSIVGKGLNCRRIEGFLYQYQKGEEVRIMCVCHGNFFSPAEFVRHAGLGDVEHPLRHIVVNSSSLV